MRKIKLKDGRYALVDNEDYELVSKYRWYATVKERQTNYLSSNINGTTIMMHRLIMGARKGQTLDHINHNGFDNRKENLRFCTQKQNCMNKSQARKNNGIKYKGVYHANGKFRVCIRSDGRTIHLGTYECQRDAAIIYNGAAMALFGEYANLNNIKNNPERR